MRDKLSSPVYTGVYNMEFITRRVEIAPIMQAASGVVQSFAHGDLPRPRVHEKTVRALLRYAPSFIAGGINTGVPYTVKDVAHALHADNALTVIAIALICSPCKSREP